MVVVDSSDDELWEGRSEKGRVMWKMSAGEEAVEGMSAFVVEGIFVL